VSVDLRVSRIYRHLTATPSFGGQIAEARRGVPPAQAAKRWSCR
jgi:hypothetical protein